jgi:hypothetical protein
MSNERGHYGNSNNVPHVGAEPPRTIYVEREHSSSVGKWLLGAIAIGGGFLYMRHQSQQIEQLYKGTGKPYQTFTGSLRETARELPVRARQAYRGLTGRVRPAAKPSVEGAGSAAAAQPAPAHSVRARSNRR